MCGSTACGAGWPLDDNRSGRNVIAAEILLIPYHELVSFQLVLCILPSLVSLPEVLEDSGQASRDGSRRSGAELREGCFGPDHWLFSGQGAESFGPASGILPCCVVIVESVHGFCLC